MIYSVQQQNAAVQIIINKKGKTVQQQNSAVQYRVSLVYVDDLYSTTAECCNTVPGLFWLC